MSGTLNSVVRRVLEEGGSVLLESEGISGFGLTASDPELSSKLGEISRVSSRTPPDELGNTYDPGKANPKLFVKIGSAADVINSHIEGRVDVQSDAAIDRSVLAAEYGKLTLNSVRITNSRIESSDTRDGTVMMGTTIDNSFIYNAGIKSGPYHFYYGSCRGSYVWYGSLSKARVKNSVVRGGSIEDSTVDETRVTDSTVTLSGIFSSRVRGSTISGATIESSSVGGATIKGGSISPDGKGRDASKGGVKIYMAEVSDAATIEDNAQIRGFGPDDGNQLAIVGGRARVAGNAVVSGRVEGQAQVFGNAQVYGQATVTGTCKVGGTAVMVRGTYTRGEYLSGTHETGDKKEEPSIADRASDFLRRSGVDSAVRSFMGGDED